MTLTTIGLILALAAGGTSERFAGRSVLSVELSLSRGQLPAEARTLVEVQPGDPYDPAAVRRSIKQLFALGSFSDIKVDARPVGDAVSLTFELYPRLTVGTVRVAPGSSRDALSMSDRILEEAAITPGESFDAVRVEEAGSAIENWLKRKGYLWAQVDADVRFSETEAEVIFHCDAGSRAIVRSLELEGLPSHVEQHVRRQLGLEPGDRYDAESLQTGVDRVLAEWGASGFYQATLDFRSLPEPPAHVRIDMTAEIGPRVIIRVAGATLSERTINRLVPVLEEASVSEDLIEESRANLEGYFRNRGYPSASVHVERERVGDQRLTLIFNVQTGDRLEVAAIRVEGAFTIDAAEIPTLLTTRPRGPFRSAPYVASTWEKDIEGVRRFLLRLGYHRARISSEVREIPDEPGDVELVIHIDEGPRAYLDSILVQGARQISSDEIISNLGFRVGEVLDAGKLVGARDRTVSLYRNQGFREVVVELATELDESGAKGTLSLLIHEGAQTRVDRIIITGLERTKEDAVRRYITFSPGAPLSSEDLLETRQGLIGTRLFRDVSIEVLPPDAATRSSDVLIQLEEGPRTTVGYGFGYGERDLARIEGQITRHNILGMNRSASVFARASFRSNRLFFSYQQPSTFGLDLPSFVSAVHEEGERADFRFKRVSVGMQVLKRVSNTQTLFFRYSLEDVDLLEEPEKPPPPEFAPAFISKLSVSSVNDTRDDPVSPTRGQFRILDFDLSAKFLGTHSPFIKGLAQQFFYVPLPSDMVFVLALRGGIGKTFREDRPEGALMPITERFFAGGANTLRGFPLDEASPKNFETGDPVGGNVLMLLNLELRLPIANKLGGVVFSDNGNVYRRVEVIELLNWRYNFGAGIRYETPIGPVRVDYGIKLNRRPDESFGRLHVSLGHPF